MHGHKAELIMHHHSMLATSLQEIVCIARPRLDSLGGTEKVGAWLQAFAPMQQIGGQSLTLSWMTPSLLQASAPFVAPFSATGLSTELQSSTASIALWSAAGFEASLTPLHKDSMTPGLGTACMDMPFLRPMTRVYCSDSLTPFGPPICTFGHIL